MDTDMGISNHIKMVGELLSTTGGYRFDLLGI